MSQETLKSPLPSLEIALEQASRHAENIRQNLTPDQEAPVDSEGKRADNLSDVSEVVASGIILERFLGDVEEAIRQVFTAGLSFPDPELHDELELLADRAERHGLPTAVGHLKRLALWISAIGEHQGAEERVHLSSSAWDETQMLLTWLRLFKTELDFLSVEGSLALDASEGGERSVSSVPTCTSTVWPVGLELEQSGKLLVFGFDVDAKMAVVLRDQLAEFNADNPLGDPAISRLFQDQVRIHHIMKGLIRLEDHPVVRRKTSMLFRPAFRAIPKSIGVTDEFTPPSLPSLDPERSRGQHVPGPVTATVAYKGGRLRWKSQYSINTNDVLQLNAMKLLAREKTSSQELELVARLQDESLRLLSACTEDDGTVFIADDPTLFRFAPNILSSSAIHWSESIQGDRITGAWLRSTAFLLGAADGDAIAGVRKDLVAAHPLSLDDHYQIGMTRFVLGDGVQPASFKEILRDTLGLASRRSSEPVALSTLSKVIGRRASSADLKMIDDDDRLVYQALWLAIQADLVSALEPELRELVKRRFSTRISTVTPSAICARALAIYLIEILDGTIDTEDDEENKSKAIEFLDAHLTDLGGRTRRGRRRRRTQMPTPDLVELFQLADTKAIVTGADRHHLTIAALGVPQSTISRMCAKAILEWRLGDPESALGRSAANAMLIVAAAGLRPLFVL